MKGVQNGICSLGCRFGFDNGRTPAYRRTASDRLWGKLRLRGRFWFLPANLCRGARPRQPRRLSGPIVSARTCVRVRRRGRGFRIRLRESPGRVLRSRGAAALGERTFRSMMPQERYDHDDRNGAPISHSSNPLPRPMSMFSASSAPPPAWTQTFLGCLKFPPGGCELRQCRWRQL